MQEARATPTTTTALSTTSTACSAAALLLLLLLLLLLPLRGDGADGADDGASAYTDAAGHGHRAEHGRGRRLGRLCRGGRGAARWLPYRMYPHDRTPGSARDPCWWALHGLRAVPIAGVQPFVFGLILIIDRADHHSPLHIPV